MSLGHYLKMAAVTVVDVFLGAGTAYYVNFWFTKNTDVNPESSELGMVQQLAALAAAQGIVTVFLADELRSFVMPVGFDDPTGGVLFMAGLTRQPKMFERLDLVFQVLHGKWKAYWTPPKSEEGKA